MEKCLTRVLEQTDMLYGIGYYYQLENPVRMLEKPGNVMYKKPLSRCGKILAMCYMIRKKA